jgi:NAD(P)-dependent dehydrogenase (short-subunit alcohol dehydrogenase family)
MERRRILLIGATGVFGQRLARHLATMAGLDLLLSSRDAGKAEHLARGLATAPGTTAAGIGLDHRSGLSERLAEMAPWLVIDASGPFQGAGYDVPRAALEAGAHVVDLADARDYILGYGAALETLARSKGLVALAGASSTPALSAAAVLELTRGWQRIDSVEIAITPGGRSPVGEAVIAAILSYVGRPIPTWREGELQETTGWLDSHVAEMPRLRRQRVAAVETVDAQWLGPRLGVASHVAFRAGLESRVEQWGLMTLARLHRSGLIEGLHRLAPALLAGRRLTRLPTSDRGGMLVQVTGLDAQRQLRHSSWSLLAERGDGPQVPILAAAATLRALLKGILEPGARPAAATLSLGQIEAEMAPYAISTQVESGTHGRAILQKALGDAAFSDLPETLRLFHCAEGPPVWHGRARIKNGASPVAWLLRRIIGLPTGGEDVPVTVSVKRLVETSGPTEIWTRNFGGQRFFSTLDLDPDGHLRERFGAATFRLGLAARGGEVHLPVTAARLFELPLPHFLLPRSEATESLDSEGRFHFDVKLTLPFFGLLVHYTGWLVPKAGTRPLTPPDA